ncbi:MAG: uracil-DNA glycosylase [Clostridiales bacterium]|nr:uracil-DNA glycosylase [Clostridiales bacterium]
MADLNLTEKWKGFEDKVRSCTACGLCQTKSNYVIYRGAVSAPLMIVGEAPGVDEDREGKPFVGLSGKLLQNALDALGFSKGDYHICNICKCHPPQNRRPTTEEIKTCKQHFAEQFRIVRPKVILLMGSTAYEAFYGSKPVMHDVRGIFDERNGYYIMTTFHPAYALRNPKGKLPIFEDLIKVRQKLVELGLKKEVKNLND